MKKYLKAIGKKLWENRGYLVPLAAAGLALAGGDALATTNITASLETSVNAAASKIVCPIAEILTGPVARFVSLGLIVGAVIYYMSNDSRSAKGLAVAAIVGIVLANTFKTWQQVITGQSYGTLCSSK